MSGLNTLSSRRLSIFPDPQQTLQLPTLSAPELANEAVKTGYLFKRGGGKVSNGWKRRWFILYQQTLLYYKNEKEKKPQGAISPLKNFVCEDLIDDSKTQRYEFRLAPKQPGTSRSYVIYATSASDKVDWMEVLEVATTGKATNKQTVEIEEKLRRNCYDIPSKDLEWGTSTDILGKGASGIVKRGLWLATTEVAVKALNNLPEFTDQQEISQFYKEIETLSQLRHPNIVPMFGYCKKDGYLCLVTEFVKGGNLSEAIHNYSKPMDLSLKIDICASICRGMVYLHSKRVIHRDLKPGNILVENIEDGKVKVCDFGLSTITKGKNDHEMTQNTFGSPAYAAPELPTSTHTDRVDVFSFAVIMWEICTRKKPWTQLSHSWQIAERVSKGERLELPPNGALNDLINRCWDLNPENRPNFTEIYGELDRIKQNLPAELKTSTSSSPGSLQSSNSSGTLSPELSRRSDGGTGQMTYYNGNQTQSLLSHPSIAPLVTGTNVIPGGSLEQRIEDSFGNRPAMPWDEFSTFLMNLLHVGKPTIEKLKFILSPDNLIVEKDLWKKFMEWFTPLTEGGAGLYQTNDAQTSQSNEGYTIEEIVNIVGQSWFFGFIDANKSRDLLEKMPIGSYLFRFSSTPKCYTMSVYYGQVGHWRIVAQKVGNSYPTFKIDDKTYKSLHDIIHTHSMQIPLIIKSGVHTECYLKVAADRNLKENKEKQPTNLYESFV